jgi:hypothetical protein
MRDACAIRREVYSQSSPSAPLTFCERVGNNAWKGLNSFWNVKGNFSDLGEISNNGKSLRLGNEVRNLINL